jgi:hypothetical protein
MEFGSVAVLPVKLPFLQRDSPRNKSGVTMISGVSAWF